MVLFKVVMTQKMSLWHSVHAPLYRRKRKSLVKDGIWGTGWLFVVQTFHTRDLAKSNILLYANTGLNIKYASLYFYLKNILQSS